MSYRNGGRGRGTNFKGTNFHNGNGDYGGEPYVEPRLGVGVDTGGGQFVGGIGRGRSRRHRNNNYDAHPHHQNGVGMAVGGVSNGHVATREANLSDFFSFPSNPESINVTPPLRWTTPSNGVVTVPVSGLGGTEISDEDGWTESNVTQGQGNTFPDDDDTNYVDFYLRRAEEQVARLNLQEAHYMSSRSSSREPSIMGTLPPSSECGRSGLNNKNHDDAQVFWKYRMDERKVDTSHLVINRYEQQIGRILENKQVLIVEGFTGCGKTTQVPQFILDHAAKNSRRVRIAVTQPRRIAAISVANRVCDERGWPLGTLVGYQVGMDRKVTDDTRVTYMTTGVLLQLLINKKNLTEYTHIIIDEVHERDLDTDLLLLVIKKIILDRRDTETRIILMSATLNTDKFLRYFPSLASLHPGSSRSTPGKKDETSSTSVVSVSQPSAFEVTEIYLDDLTNRFGFDGFEVDGSEEPKLYPECYELACRIINGLDYHEYVEECKRMRSAPGEMTDIERGEFTTSEFYRKRQEKPPTRGAVLVFLPGFLEIDTLYKQLLELSVVKAGNYNRPDVAKWTLYPLHSSVTAEEQQKVFKSAASGFRKIILATNIAESSITVPDIKYVIDFCLTKSLSCDPSTNFTCLRLEWASRNQCIQRRGRCGRVAPGMCYRLINESFFRGLLPQEARPEMERASLESVVLNVKQLQMGCPLEVLAHAIDPPKKSGIKRAVNNLKEVGALTLTINGKYDPYDGDRTFMGSVMAKLPIDFRLGRLIVLGHVLGCVDDAIIIAAGLSTKSPFSHPYAKRLEAWLSKFGWSNRTYSDCFALLNAFYTWSQNHRNHVFRTYSEEKNWARTYYVQLSVIREIGTVVEEVKKRLQNVGIFSDSFALPDLERGFILKLLIAGAFYPNYFGRPRPTRKEYERETIREVSGYNPLSSVVFMGFPIDQPAELYARHIADKMAYTNCIPHINFKSSKVIVSFDPRGDKIGSISYGVYRALKMRQLRDRVTFLTLPREEAKKSFNSGYEFIQEHPVVLAPKSASLPSILETQFNCVVCHVSETESPHEFYVMRQDDVGCLAQINEILNSDTGCTARQRLRALTSDERQPGAICIIVKKKQYFRCRIESLTLDQVLVYAIDTGTIFWRTFQQVFQVTDEMIKRGLVRFPALAIPCRLSELKPSCRHAHDWVHQACQDFATFLDNSSNEFIFKIHSVVDGIVAGELYSPIMDQTINELFVRKTYLEKTTESQDSTENNNYRRLVNVMRYDDEMIKAIDGRQAGNWEPTRYVNPPKITPDNGTDVTLRGPNSPLEMQFTSLCRSAHMKQVQVEGSSVNCVALDTEPFNPCSRVMVSASIGIAHKSGNLMARDTTIMPPIPGLLSILTLVFAPRLEFRLDRDHTKYTGCISGLGTDSEGHSVYEEDDMEVIFDVKIDNEDLDLVNSIRMTCNMLLRENAGQHCTLESLREKVRTELTRLVQRDREGVDEIWPDITHVWNRLKGVVYHHAPDQCAVFDNDVFSLHVGVRHNPPRDGEPAHPSNVFQPPFQLP